MKKFAIILFLTSAISTFATHIVGGDITVKHLSGNNFEVTMHIYRDCANGLVGFENPSTIGLYDLQTHAQIYTIDMPLISKTILQLGDPCKPPTNLCVEDGLFVKTITIPNNPNGYYLSWQRCCRNGIIDNIIQPGDAGMVVYCEIADPDVANSTPTFNKTYPNPVMCSTSPNIEDFSATDIDGDQLVYSLVTPLNGNSYAPGAVILVGSGPYPNVVFAPPYSAANMIGGSPVMGINNSTGILTANPNTIGEYVFSVRVEEFRNGIKLGEIRRELQYQVISCPVPLPPTTTVNACGNQTLTAAAGSATYNWTNTAGGTIGITGASNTQSIIVNQSGSYQVVMSPFIGATCTTSAIVNVVVNPTPVPNFTNTIVCEGTSTQFTDNSTPTGSITAWAWDYNNDGIADNNNQNPNYIFPAAGTYAVTLVVTQGACTSSITLNVTVNPNSTVSAGPDQTICAGSQVVLAGSFTGLATTGTWTGGAGVFTPNNTATNAIYTPTATEEAAGTVTLTYTTDAPTGPCAVTIDQMIITINRPPTANAGNQQYACAGTTFSLNGSIGGSALTGTWSGGAGTFTPNNTSLNAAYTPTTAEYATGSVVLTLTTDDPAGPCQAASSNVTLIFHPNPLVNFTVDVPKGCPVHCVNFTDLSVVALPSTLLNWMWDFGDGQTSTTQNPQHCYSNTGYYDVSLTVSTSDGCVGVFSTPQMIQVYAFPIAAFDATPNPATVINPLVSFTDQSSSDVVYWDWSFGDGTSHPDNITPDPTHLYSNISAANYIATLIVQNADGCWDTVAHSITIGPEFTFYIPNAFTPNGDGKNDDFNGVGIGIVEYDILIFDRWGNEVFHGNDISQRWDGKVKHANEIAQQDVYVWKVVLKDVFKEIHNYTGTVTLIK